MSEIELKDFKFNTSEYITAPEGAPYLVMPERIEQLQTHLKLAVSALNQLERILTYDDNYNGTDMLKIIREARK